MSKKTFSKIKCEKLDDFGLGIVYLDNLTCFVNDLLPGEIVDIETTFTYGKLSSCKVLKRYNDSPYRVKPICPLYKECGGCQIMHLSYEKQLEYKKEKVKQLLHKFTKIDFNVENTLPVINPIRFRNKVQKPIRLNPKTKKIEAGFYQSDTHKLVKVDDCLMESELSSKITKVVIQLLQKYHYQPYDEDKQTGIVRHLLIKTNSEQSEALVTLIVTTPQLKGRSEFAKELISKVAEVKGVVLNINNRKTNVILGEKDISVYGYERIKDKIFNKKFLISTQSFYQTNSKQVENLYKTAIDLAKLTKEDTVLDAYCGTGTIGISLSDYVKSVTGVEINKQAINDAIFNAKINNVKNIKFICDDCSKYMLSNKEKFSVIIMDPPRKGSTKEFIDACKTINPKKIVYISCDPSTLARDLALFKDKYEIKKVIPVDMFPNTLHVETIVLMLRIEK